MRTQSSQEQDMSQPHRITAALAAALAVGAVVAPAGVAKPPDLNGPPPAVAGLSQDLRSADRQDDRDPGVSGAVVDLRSPDRQSDSDPGAQPYSRGSTAFSGSASSTDATNLDRRVLAGPPTWPAYPTPLVPASSNVSSSSDGFEWGSAAAGAGTMLAIGLASLGGWLAVSRRRGAPGAKPTTVAAGH
jgi:hypothetical protein